MILRLAIVGFGNVGQEFARLLQYKREWLLRNKGLDIEILAIATKSRGTLLSKRALDVERVLNELESKGTLAQYGPEAVAIDAHKLIETCDADIMIELTTLNIDSGQPAIDHIKTAFNVGLDVITANKGPIAFAYEELRNAARGRGVRFRFEGTVMDGTPVFNLVEKTLQGCEILGLEGILNSTSNFVLTEMSHGKDTKEAIRMAQSLGFAEADPSLDIDGWDASAKITALANVLMDAGKTPKMVDRKGIKDISERDVKNALAEGKRYRLVAKASREGSDIKLEVRPVLVQPDSTFYSVEGTSSALTIKTDLMGDITIIESGPAVAQTAYALFSDLLLVVESIRTGTIC